MGKINHITVFLEKIYIYIFDIILFVNKLKVIHRPTLFLFLFLRLLKKVSKTGIMIILSTMHSPTCLPSTWQSAPTASPHPSLLYQTLCCTPKNSSSTCLDLSVLMLRRPTSLFHRRLLCQDLPNSNIITSLAKKNWVAKKKNNYGSIRRFIIFLLSICMGRHIMWLMGWVPGFHIIIKKKLRVCLTLKIPRTEPPTQCF